MNTPSGTGAITESTSVKSPIGRAVVIVGGLCVIVATATAAYVRLLGRFEAHLADTSVHLNPEFHAGHGRPVGSFDFGIAVQQITTKLDALEEKIGAMVCKPKGGGAMECNPKGEP